MGNTIPSTLLSMKLLFAALVGAASATSVAADCDLTKMSIYTYSDTACATAAAVAAAASGTVQVWFNANKATAGANSATYSALNANNKCFTVTPANSGTVVNYGAVCTSTAYTFYTYLTADTTC